MLQRTRCARPKPIPRPERLWVMAGTAKSYAEKRDFKRTPEPAGTGAGRATARADRKLAYVVQKHDASRLHYDFRLEHDGVLLSWAVPKGPSLDPKDKRLAVHVEDHPLDYARFEGEIPAGNYGAGTVEIWDRGHWFPRGNAAEGLASGDLKFRLEGERYNGNFVLVRMKPRPKEHAENWLLIKERDDPPAADARPEKRTDVKDEVASLGHPAPPKAGRSRRPAGIRPRAMAGTAEDASDREDGGATGERDTRYAPQLATLVDTPPEGPEWITEIKYDGYRLIAVRDGDEVRLLTRNGLDWTHRLPSLASAVASLASERVVLDGELVAIDPDGATSFGSLQAALSDQRDEALVFMAFDLLGEAGEDTRALPLSERKARLERICPAARGKTLPLIRFSAHLEADAAAVSREACRLGLEGVVCKRLDRPYRAGRSRDWVKVKCDHRDELIVLGWTRPKGARTGLGALHLGAYDDQGRLSYAGGCGTGFSTETLESLASRLKPLAAKRPPDLVAAEKPPTGLNWVEPVLVAQIGHAGFTESGMLRHARFLGLREDKPASEVRRSDAEPAPPAEAEAKARVDRPAARPAKSGPRLTHPDRELWPGITKQDLADYWAAVADHALPGIAERPLALLRCPEGIEGETFFQKHAMRGNPPSIREGETDGAPWLAIADADGLASLAQLSAIELHAWGSSLAAPDKPDRLVFDLDPDPSVGFADVIEAARDIAHGLEAVGLEPFIRTSGGKGLHLVVPLVPEAGWDEARAWSRAFAIALERAEPKRFIASSTRKNVRSGKILIDWLRNGLGSTAIASFSPRARPGATVATPLAWREVGSRLDPSAYTLKTVPARLARQRRDPWDGFTDAAARLPALPASPEKN